MLRYQTTAEHFKTWLDLANAGQIDGQVDHQTPMPCVRQAVRKYLECSIFAHGFARARCGDCRHDYFVAYSCKRRDGCPLCNTWRMVKTAAHLTDRVFPRMQVRQWVLAGAKTTNVCRFRVWPIAGWSQLQKLLQQIFHASGYVGNGNLLFSYLIDPTIPEEWRVAVELDHKLVTRALALEDTCTGERDVCMHKMDFLIAETGDGAVNMMRIIKRALDPKNIMNPGKIFSLQGY